MASLPYSRSASHSSRVSAIFAVRGNHGIEESVLHATSSLLGSCLSDSLLVAPLTAFAQQGQDNEHTHSNGDALS